MTSFDGLLKDTAKRHFDAVRLSHVSSMEADYVYFTSPQSGEGCQQLVYLPQSIIVFPKNRVLRGNNRLAESRRRRSSGSDGGNLWPHGCLVSRPLSCLIYKSHSPPHFLLQFLHPSPSHPSLPHRRPGRPQDSLKTPHSAALSSSMSDESIIPGDIVLVNHGHYGRKEGLVVGSHYDYAGRQVVEVQLEPGEIYNAWLPTVTRVRRTTYYSSPPPPKRVATVERRVYW
ncbi:hypothetical protein BDY19DRAFT_944748 [Irpex rosettiformis]|uniref:Uncharacterized protein n=1 Tax=Irpex rosettiformis TaxID=378272 RepID=A0ACB8U4M3_9APHY|nr:hypothetical protein BDY19DRAFT_944748 [Irpex rosettiformis]